MTLDEDIRAIKRDVNSLNSNMRGGLYIVVAIAMITSCQNCSTADRLEKKLAEIKTYCHVREGYNK